MKKRQISLDWWAVMVAFSVTLLVLMQVIPQVKW